MSKIIDLHIHTTMSDGELTPKQVVEEAYKNGVSIISIVDHDTIAAYDKELYSFAKQKNIEIINGVEISTKFNKIGFHVLGYNFDINNKQMKEKLCKIRNTRYEYLHKVSKRLEELGYNVDVKKLDKIKSVTKAHISLDVISNKNNIDILLKTFKHIPNKGEFIEKIMNENCPAYVEKETITPKEAAEIIRKANGKVVLAHPVSYIHEDNLNEKDILNIVKDMKGDGIEANYLYVDYNNKKINEIKKWNDFAIKNNLQVTVGSDFHNKDKIRPEIGFINTDFILEENKVNKIIKDLNS